MSTKNNLELASGGIEVTRSPVTEAEQRRRHGVRSRAREVITSWVSGVERSELFAALGLDVVDDGPPADPQPPPERRSHQPAHVPDRPPMPALGRCPICHELAPLTAVGRIDRHPARVVGAGGKPRPDLTRRCGGFTRYPQETK